MADTIETDAERAARDRRAGRPPSPGHPLRRPLEAPRRPRRGRQRGTRLPDAAEFRRRAAPPAGAPRLEAPRGRLSIPAGGAAPAGYVALDPGPLPGRSATLATALGPAGHLVGAAWGGGRPRPAGVPLAPRRRRRGAGGPRHLRRRGALARQRGLRRRRRRRGGGLGERHRAPGGPRPALPVAGRPAARPGVAPPGRPRRGPGPQRQRLRPDRRRLRDADGGPGDQRPRLRLRPRRRAPARPGDRRQPRQRDQRRRAGRGGLFHAPGGEARVPVRPGLRRLRPARPGRPRGPHQRGGRDQRRGPGGRLGHRRAARSGAPSRPTPTLAGRCTWRARRASPSRSTTGGWWWGATAASASSCGPCAGTSPPGSSATSTPCWPPRATRVGTACSRPGASTTRARSPSPGLTPSTASGTTGRSCSPRPDPPRPVRAVTGAGRGGRRWRRRQHPPDADADGRVLQPRAGQRVLRADVGRQLPASPAPGWETPAPGSSTLCRWTRRTTTPWRSTAPPGPRRTPSTRTPGRAPRGRRRRSPGATGTPRRRGCGRSRPAWPASTWSSWAAARPTSRPGWPGAGPGPWGSTRPRRSWPPPGAASRSWGLPFPLVEAPAERVPLPDAAFDLAVSEYGASVWADPHRWIPEAARLLRPGGRLVFLRPSTLAVLCSPDTGPVGERLARPQFGLHRLDWRADGGGIAFHLGHGDWLRLLRASGFEVLRPARAAGPARRAGAPLLRRRPRGLGPAVAGRGDLGRPEARPRRRWCGRSGLTRCARRGGGARVARRRRSRGAEPSVGQSDARDRSGRSLPRPCAMAVAWIPRGPATGRRAPGPPGRRRRSPRVPRVAGARPPTAQSGREGRSTPAAPQPAGLGADPHPRSASRSSTSRWLRWNRTYRQTAWLMRSPGKRWRLERGDGGCPAESSGTRLPKRQHVAVTIVTMPPSGLLPSYSDPRRAARRVAGGPARLQRRVPRQRHQQGHQHQARGGRAPPRAGGGSGGSRPLGTATPKAHT